MATQKKKTHRGAAKRFKLTANGKLMRGQSGKRHILTKKATKRKRQLRGTTGVHASDTKSIRAMMPYA